jgi:NAD(P)-dependent dehydrogenase (short-subunit alcohol dehydrogenase family)
MGVNLARPFLLAQALAPKMIEKRAGKIVNVSSQTSEVASTSMPPTWPPRPASTPSPR